MGVMLHTLRELRSLSPEDMRSLSSYLREWAEEKENGTEAGADHGDPEITVAYCEEVRENLRKLDITARDMIIKRLREDMTEDIMASQEAAEGEPIAPDFRALIFRELDRIKDPDLLERTYYRTNGTRREQELREEACRNGK